MPDKGQGSVMSDSSNEVIERLRALMKGLNAAKTDWDAVTPESTVSSLGFDSLSVLDLIYDIEQEFGFEFDAADVASLRTVGELADFIAGRIQR